MIKEAKILGMTLGIPCLDGIEEAEAQCALLNSASLCDGCFTLDSDIFLFGAKMVYRDIILGEGGHVICYEMADIEKKLGFGRNSLIALAILLGSDYSPGVRGFSPEIACQLVKSIGDDKVLLKVKSEGLGFLRKCKTTKKATRGLNSNAKKENEPCYTQCFNRVAEGKNTGSDDRYLQVIDAYVNPKCHLPDSDIVHRACSQYSFVRTQLHQICKQYFDWSPEKTDEYILPKIAERDLRRFANLRSTSSKLGVIIPLDQMPVPCPVSDIVKQRKIQGRECYEVSWCQMEGFRTSIVPADLVESACPEKISEFVEAKCEAKRKQNRKPRPKKSTKADMAEVDLQLKSLMLSKDSPSNSSTNSIKDKKVCTAQNVMKSETFIDLSSPSPPLWACKLAKHEVNIDKYTDVIDICELDDPNAEKHDVVDLCESDTDPFSPEHEKKSRELRLFLSSIRDDLY